MALEKAAVEAAAVRLCPPHAVLERVVLTPSGNLLACWQVAQGADPAELRRCAPPPQPVTPPATLRCAAEPAEQRRTTHQAVLPVDECQCYLINEASASAGRWRRRCRARRRRSSRR